MRKLFGLSFLMAVLAVPAITFTASEDDGAEATACQESFGGDVAVLDRREYDATFAEAAALVAIAVALDIDASNREAIVEVAATPRTSGVVAAAFAREIGSLLNAADAKILTVESSEVLVVEDAAGAVELVVNAGKADYLSERLPRSVNVDKLQKQANEDLEKFLEENDCEGFPLRLAAKKLRSRVGSNYLDTEYSIRMGNSRFDLEQSVEAAFNQCKKTEKVAK